MMEDSLPPPIPKRIFKNNSNDNDQNHNHKQTVNLNEEYQKNQQRSGKNKSSHNSEFHNSKRIEYLTPMNKEELLKHYVQEEKFKNYYRHIVQNIKCDDQVSDDDRNSLENSVFEEDLPSLYYHYQKNNLNSISPKGSNSMFNSSLNENDIFTAQQINGSNIISSKHLQSNRSSSDSNKSQGTNDTGYRSRFSSVDTESSLESCLTEKTIDSPLSKESFNIDFGKQSDQNYSSYCNYSSEQKRNSRNLPVVPLRNPSIRKHKLKSPGVNEEDSNNKYVRQPPVPPSRSQLSIESVDFQGLNSITTGRKLPNISLKQTTSQKLREKFGKNCPPPLQYTNKLQQRQDSSLSSDSYSMTSSPGYNTKNGMETPLIQHATRINHSVTGSKTTENNGGNCSSRDKRSNPPPLPNRVTIRQDSTISSDSLMSTSSPGYNTEAPLLPSLKKSINGKQTLKISNDIIQEYQDQLTDSSSPTIKNNSTPASLQTVVRFENGTSNMSLQHRILNRRKSSVPTLIVSNRLKFRLIQLLINALALLAIAGGLVAYFNAYPTIKFINKTIITPIRIQEPTESNPVAKNPAPGICLPIIVKFCQTPHVPYNYTVFPNYIGHFGQLETQVDLEAYDALVDVRCYELVSLFLCTLFVPKCGPTGTTVPPCKSLCIETMRRCGFFFDVFGLQLPDYLDCNLFLDHKNPDECVGYQEVKDIMRENSNPSCSGFLCDSTRCIPNDWRCDGHVDCYDQTDESNCDSCDKNSIYCGEGRCMSQKHMCDGKFDCPYGQDERSCVRLSERNGDVGKGILEIYRINGTSKDWTPACMSNWDNTFSPPAICSMLGYDSVNHHQLSSSSSNNITTVHRRKNPHFLRKSFNMMEEFINCSSNKTNYPIIELTCSNYECGKIPNKRRRLSKRIVGGSVSKPGDWPFLAAILGGPEEIFYCAGVLISDQWVLTASHCIGNHTLRDINDWTIQLGITRRNSHAYYGQKVKVITVIPHPQYNTEIAHDNDIALFQLSKRVAFHDYLRPVCLPPPNQELKAGTYCTVIGWGKREDKNLNRNSVSNANTASYELSVNEVKVPVIKREICNEWLESLNVTEGMICAGYADGGKDACQGDSGGPLLCPYPGKRDKWFVGGIVSWGIMCAHPRLPGVYANVFKYIPWIKNEISKYNNKRDNKKNNHKL